MAIKDIIKLFLPPIVLKIKSWGQRNKLHESPLPQIEHHSDKMIIIGNGPSLNITVNRYKEQILSCDRIAVNFFAASDLYEELKPNIYVFADPAFFNSPDNQKKSVENLFNSLISRTIWPLHIIIPLSAKDALSVTKLHQNQNICIDYYYDGWNDIGKMNKFEAWNRNLIVPPAQNVLNVALYLSLFWNYEETYLIGADSSFLEDLRVDQETNELFTIDTHFYNNEKVYSDKDLFHKTKGRVRSDWTLHELIYAHGRMFEYYYELKQYADYKGLKVYNASDYSWINVFERKNLC